MTIEFTKQNSRDWNCALKIKNKHGSKMRTTNICFIAGQFGEAFATFLFIYKRLALEAHTTQSF